MGSLPSERIALVATVDPDANATGAFTSDYVNMEEFGEALAIVMAGVLAASGTLDAAVLQATSSTGASVKAIRGKSITQLDTASNDKQQLINIQTDELDVAGGFSFIALRLTHTTAGGDAAGLILGTQCRHAPADDYDLASVSEIVA